MLFRSVDEHVLSAPLLGDDAVLGELLAHAVGVGARLIDLVDCNDDGYAGCLVLFISSISESVIISAILTFAALFLSYMAQFGAQRLHVEIGGLHARLQG